MEEHANLFKDRLDFGLGGEAADQCFPKLYGAARSCEGGRPRRSGFSSAPASGEEHALGNGTINFFDG